MTSVTEHTQTQPPFREKFREKEETNHGGDAEADPQSNRSRGPPWHLRRRARRRACGITRIEPDIRDGRRARASHPPSPQWPELQPNQGLRFHGGPDRRLPMQREKHPADLSLVLLSPESGDLDHTRIDRRLPSQSPSAPDESRHRLRIALDCSTSAVGGAS